jgi:CheY-like chemotaxis protein
LVCANEVELASMIATVGAQDLDPIGVATAGEALAVLKQQYLDGILVHLRIDGIAPLALVEEIQSHAGPYAPPILLMCDRPLTGEEELELARLGRAGIVKTVQTRERLLDESVLLLHRAESDLAPDQRRILEQLRETDVTLFGKKVLVVDDDVRNIFALTSLLEDHNLKVAHAENGRAGIELLKKTPDVDLVLMDIMMPEMDGLTAMREIRKRPEWKKLPIIALTAKAMRDDQEKCLAAGANDYIAKPLDVEKLLSLVRVWMPK